MLASRLTALACAAALLVGGVAAPAQVPQNETYAPPAYATPPPPPLPPPPYQPGAQAYQPVDPGYVAPQVGDTGPIPIQPAPDGLYNNPNLPPAPPSPYPLPETGPPPVAPPLAVAPGQPVALGCTPKGTTAQSGTLSQDDVVSAAEGVFGKGAEGLAGLVQKVFKDRGQPNAYIAGREAGGAFIVGVRYGSGIMCHSIEGDKKVFWTGPSVGFDAGADANKVFVLVYNLHDSQELFRRYPTAEGRAYFVGGLAASILKRGDVVLVPIRLGVGLRLGVNAGYMAFSEKSKILPF